MAITRKVEKIGAMRLGTGKLNAGTAHIWGGSTIMSLGANNAFAYTTIDISKKPEHAEDPSIQNAAFQSLPVLTGKFADISINGIYTYQGLDKFLYWMFGYEDGASSPQSLSDSYYRHVYELDQHERHLTSYRANEDTAGDYNANDRKNRMADMAWKLGTNDFRYPFSMCTGFGFSSKAGGLLEWNCKAMCYDETRGDYSSANWTLPIGQGSSSLDAAHHHLTLSLGVAGSLVAIDVTSFSLDVTIPLQKLQHSTSGYFAAEPVFSGKYSYNVSLVIARHSVDTYLAYRDAFTQLAMKADYVSGSYRTTFCFPSVKIIESNVPDEEISTNPVTFALGEEPVLSSPVFATESGTVAMIEGGNVFVITENKNSVNEMRRE